MIIQRTSATTISPRAREELMCRQSLTFYNAPRELRKPLGIYNVSLLNIWESFIEVLNELDAVMVNQTFRQQPPMSRWDKTLVRRHETLIGDLMRHFDDCLSLLSCFYPKKHSTFEEDKKYVMRQPPIQAAMIAAQPYREHIANIINHIKHQQGALRGVAVFNDNVAIPGYFVEHVDQQEVLGPHPNVHTPYRGQNTAFSFSRDLRYKFWIVYAVSEIVADAIVQIAPVKPNSVGDTDIDSVIVEIATRLANLPKWTFKDEAELDFPEIEAVKVNGVTQLTLEFPSNRAILPALFGTSYVSAGWVGDAVTRSFRPPYFNP